MPLLLRLNVRGSEDWAFRSNADRRERLWKLKLFGGIRDRSLTSPLLMVLQMSFSAATKVEDGFYDGSSGNSEKSI